MTVIHPENSIDIKLLRKIETPALFLFQENPLGFLLVLVIGRHATQ